jgi:hypothetical protein
MRQGHDLGYASGFFENDHVMGIETYGSIPDRILWCYGEYQILYGTVDGVDFQQ